VADRLSVIAGQLGRLEAEAVALGVEETARLRTGLAVDDAHQLAAMNETLGVTTLLLSARPGLAATSSTMARGLGR
jgi:hypothetical protein